MSVYKKLNEAREKFHTLKLTKTGHNKFAGYNYFELGDFLIPALKVFNEVGLCAIVSFDTGIASMTIVDLATPGGSPEKIVITSPMGSAALKGCHEVQNIGAVETYQRRYLWVAALEIVEHDALDATTGAKDHPTAITTDGVLDDEAARYIQLLAFELPQIISEQGPAEGAARLEREALDTAQKLYLWGLLDSKTRSAIKKAQGLTPEHDGPTPKKSHWPTDTKPKATA